MKKVIFLHGFFASGDCQLAHILRNELKGIAEVIAPDLPRNPYDAIDFIHRLCDAEKPDLLVGNSCGSFYGLFSAPIVGVPAMLGNPHLAMTTFLEPRVGEHEYKSPRQDGNQVMIIDQELIDAFAKLEAEQFNYTNPYFTNRVWGLFGEHDTIAHYESTFLEHYDTAFHFPGGHAPSAEEVAQYYVPLVKRMLNEVQPAADRSRYFQHFKGGKYRFVNTAYDSETQERMVVYQALYGAKDYWVRPEKMFFEHVTRDGKTMSRFTEIDKSQIE